jgi:hypothetical protein
MLPETRVKTSAENELASLAHTPAICWSSSAPGS